MRLTQEQKDARRAARFNQKEAERVPLLAAMGVAKTVTAEAEESKIAECRAALTAAGYQVVNE